MASSKEAALDKLQQTFRARLPQRVDALRAALAQSRHGETSLAFVRELAHRLRGSAGSFGHPQLGLVVGELDDTLTSLLNAGVRPSESEWIYLESTVEAARIACEETVSDEGANHRDQT